jgi:hypothetical protein
MKSTVAPVDGEFERGKDVTKHRFESTSRPREMIRDTDATETATLPPECGTFALIQESAVQKDAKNEVACRRKVAVCAKRPNDAPKKLKLMLPVEGKESPTNTFSCGAE